MLVRSGKTLIFTLHHSLLHTIQRQLRLSRTIIDSPLTCPLNLQCYHSTTPADSTFGSLPDSFRYTWTGHNYAYTEDPILATKALQHATYYSDSNSPFMLVLAFLKRAPDTPDVPKDNEYVHRLCHVTRPQALLEEAPRASI